MNDFRKEIREWVVGYLKGEPKMNLNTKEFGLILLETMWTINCYFLLFNKEVLGLPRWRSG